MAVIKLEVTWTERTWVNGNPREPRHLHQFGRWERPLCRQQCRFPGDEVFRRRELESEGGVEGIARQSGKPWRPHQRGIEDRVGDERRTTLVARAGGHQKSGDSPSR